MLHNKKFLRSTVHTYVCIIEFWILLQTVLVPCVVPRIQQVFIASNGQAKSLVGFRAQVQKAHLWLTPIIWLYEHWHCTTETKLENLNIALQTESCINDKTDTSDFLWNFYLWKYCGPYYPTV